MNRPDAAVPATPRGNMNFVLMCVFIDMLGIGLVVPVLPLIFANFADTRAEQAALHGAFTTLFGVLQFIFMPLLGALSDRIGRKPVLLFSMAGMGVNFLSTALATSIPLLLIGRIIGGMSSASVSVANSYAADVSAPAERAAAFGKIGAAFGMGFICGPVIGGLLGSVNLYLPLYFAAALSLANLLYGWRMLPESLPPQARKPIDWRRLNPLATLLHFVRQPGLQVPLLIVMLCAFAQMLLQSNWVLYTNFRYNWGPLESGFSLFLVGLCAASVQAGLLPRLRAWFGDKRLGLLGLGCGAVVYLGYGLATQGWMLYLLILCNLLAFAAGPVLQAMLSNQVAPYEQGAFQGSVQAINSLGVIFMPLIGSHLLAQMSALPADDWRAGEIYYLCAIMQGVASMLLWRCFKCGWLREADAQDGAGKAG
ncbi:MFS transporter [Massilia sp. W12]|uniref:MFS transporter n=1 Tax=Massilia sp. W12 TaxID=3126507 RepID=UPI0030D1FB7F